MRLHVNARICPNRRRFAMGRLEQGWAVAQFGIRMEWLLCELRARLVERVGPTFACRTTR